MAYTKVSALTAKTTPAGTEELLINDGGVSKKITQTNLLSTALPLAGGTMTGDVSLGDNVKAKFGASDDLQIYHDGSNSYIKDVGTGDLSIQATNDLTLKGYSSQKTFINCNSNSSVQLYYDGTEKLATTSTGIDVTGSVTCDGFTSTGIDDNATSTKLTVSNTAITQTAGTAINIATGSAGTTITPSGWTNKHRFGAMGTSGSSNEMSSNYNTNTGTIDNTSYGTAKLETTSSGIVKISTGTTNTAPTERMRIDSAGNVGIGVVPESDWDSVHAALQIGFDGSLMSHSTSSGWTQLMKNSRYVGGGVYNRIATNEATRYIQKDDGTHAFEVAGSAAADSAISWTTAMTIDNSGNVLIDTTDTTLYNNTTGNGIALLAGGEIQIARSQNAVMHLNRMTDDGTLVKCRSRGVEVGSISVTSSATSYNTSSDYRLKENVVPMTGSIDRLKALNPSRFNFKADTDKTVDGFLAHEAGEVVPECATGTKDAMMTEEYTVSEALGEVFIAGIEEVTNEVQVMETVEGDTYVNLAGETITETSEVGKTIEVTTTAIQRQDIDGVMTEVEVEQVSQEPVMETVVTTQAVAEVIVSSNVEKPETDVEGQQWREVTAKVMGEREVEDYQGIDQAKLVPLLVATVQELIAKVEALEAV